MTNDPQTELDWRQLANYRLHDLRVTCKTRLVDLGISGEIRDAVVGHAKRGLERIYNKNDYLDAKRHALQAYADHLEKIVQGPPTLDRSHRPQPTAVAKAS